MKKKMEHIRELQERVADLVLNAQADAETIAELRRKESAVPGLQALLSEVNAELDKRADKARDDAKNIRTTRRTIRGLRVQVVSLEFKAQEATRLAEKEKADRKEILRHAVEIRADLAKATRLNREADLREGALFDRAVAAETKLDAAKVEVENKKAWYDMKLAGEVALRAELEERIVLLEQSMKSGVL